MRLWKSWIVTKKDLSVFKKNKYVLNVTFRSHYGAYEFGVVFFGVVHVENQLVLADSYVLHCAQVFDGCQNRVVYTLEVHYRLSVVEA